MNSAKHNETPEDFAHEWIDSGMKPPMAATSPRWARCQVPGCGLLSFVVLRMADYAEAVCLTHFNRIQEIASALTSI